MTSTFIATAIALTAVQAEAFCSMSSVYSPGTTTKTTTTTTVLNLQRPVAGIHFQLEELEDAEACSTDVLLNADLTVSLGETDGPRYTASSGIWSETSTTYNIEDPENFKRHFEMKISRTFVTGADSKDENELGEFEYNVERTYTGECFLVGESTIAVNGEILDVDEIFGDRRVGFFNMIDATEEREANGVF